MQKIRITPFIVAVSLLLSVAAGIAQAVNSAVMTVDPIKISPRSDENIEVRVQIKNTGEEGLEISMLECEIDSRLKQMGATVQTPDISGVIQKGGVKSCVFTVKPAPFFLQYFLSHITTSKSDLSIKVTARLANDPTPITPEPVNPAEITFSSQDSFSALVIGGFIGGALLVLFRILLAWHRKENHDDGNPVVWPGWKKMVRQGVAGFMLAGVMALCVLILSSVSTKFAHTLGLQFTVHSFIGSVTVGLLMFTLLDKVEELLGVNRKVKPPSKRTAPAGS